MKKHILFLFGLFLFMISCGKKIDTLDINKYADKFKFKDLKTFDARTIPPDLNQIDDKGLLTNLWQDKDKFISMKNYYYSLQNSSGKFQEFAVVTGNPEKKDEMNQIWYFIYKDGKQLARFIISESDPTAKSHSEGSIKNDGKYYVTSFDADKSIGTKSYFIDEKGNLKEGAGEAEKTQTEPAVAQEFSAKNLFTQKSIVYCGLDFSHARFAGKALQDVGEIKNKLFRDWNDVVLDEKNKFDFADFFNKESVTNDVNGINSRNAGRSTGSMKAKSPVSSIGAGSAQGSAYGLSLKEKHGIGVLLVVDAFDDDKDQAAFWVNVFDIASRKSLITERVTGKPHGSGLRNYWINAIYEGLVHIDRYSYNEWKQKYSR